MEAAAFVELGKIFIYVAAGEFRLPRAYYFVAPRGVVRKVQSLIAHPERFRAAFNDRWNDVCAPSLVENATVPLTAEIEAVIRAFDFTEIYALDAGKIVEDPTSMPVLVKWFDADPGEAPSEEMPVDLQDEEAPYLRQLVEAYGEREAVAFSSAEEVLSHAEWGDDLREQRERFFHARTFKRFYRENTFPEVLSALEDDVYHGVIDTYRDTHPDALDRIRAVMREAKNMTPTGVLARYARVPVRQGICHHFQQ